MVELDPGESVGAAVQDVWIVDLIFALFYPFNDRSSTKSWRLCGHFISHSSASAGDSI